MLQNYFSSLLAMLTIDEPRCVVALQARRICALNSANDTVSKDTWGSTAVFCIELAYTAVWDAGTPVWTVTWAAHGYQACRLAYTGLLHTPSL